MIFFQSRRPGNTSGMKRISFGETSAPCGIKGRKCSTRVERGLFLTRVSRRCEQTQGCGVLIGRPGKEN